MSRAFFLKTPRLGFSRWRESDLALARQLWGDARVTKLIGAERGFSAEQIESRLALEIANEREFGVQYWPVFRLLDDVFMGACGLRPYDLPWRIYELGAHLVPDVWGNGYASEAARAVIDYAFVSLGAENLFCGHNPNNTASRRLVEKLGFHFIGEEYYAPTGLMHPSYLYIAPPNE